MMGYIKMSMNNLNGIKNLMNNFPKMNLYEFMNVTLEWQELKKEYTLIMNLHKTCQTELKVKVIIVFK